MDKEGWQVRVQQPQDADSSEKDWFLGETAASDGSRYAEQILGGR